MKQSPLFVKSFETLEWILNHTRKFPKNQRFVLAKRIEEAALDFHDGLLMAVRVSKRNVGKKLLDADFHLARLKDYNRLAMKLKLHSFKQYEYLGKELDELGRMLGAWLKSTGSLNVKANFGAKETLSSQNGVVGE